MRAGKTNERGRVGIRDGGREGRTEARGTGYKGERKVGDAKAR